MDLSMFLKNQTVIVKVTDAKKGYSKERPDYWRVDAELEDGSKTFIVLSQKEVDDLPPMKEGYADLTTVARISKWSKGNKSGSYLERLTPLPPLKKSTSEWKNPFIEVVKKP